MKHTEYLSKLKETSPDLDRRLEAEKMRVDLAVAIAQKRASEGLSQKAIAQRAHLTQQQVSRIEKGGNCTIDTYFKAMAALGMNFKELSAL